MLYKSTYKQLTLGRRWKFYQEREMHNQGVLKGMSKLNR